jgi:hypothetical protein
MCVRARLNLVDYRTHWYGPLSSVNTHWHRSHSRHSRHRTQTRIPRVTCVVVRTQSKAKGTTWRSSAPCWCRPLHVPLVFGHTEGCKKGKTGPVLPFLQPSVSTFWLQKQCGRKMESANNAQMGAAQQRAKARWVALTVAVTLGVLYVFSDFLFLPSPRPKEERTTTAATSGQRRVVHSSAAYPRDQARTTTCQLDAALRQVFAIRTCGPLTPVRPQHPAPPPQVYVKPSFCPVNIVQTKTCGRDCERRTPSTRAS